MDSAICILTLLVFVDFQNLLPCLKFEHFSFHSINRKKVKTWFHLEFQIFLSFCPFVVWSFWFLSVDSFSSTLLGRPFDVKYFPILSCGQNFLFSISLIKAFGHSLVSMEPWWASPGASSRGQAQGPTYCMHVTSMHQACWMYATSMLPAAKSILLACYQHIVHMPT